MINQIINDSVIPEIGKELIVEIKFNLIHADIKNNVVFIVRYEKMEAIVKLDVQFF